MAQVGRLQMFHRAMIHPDSLLGAPVLLSDRIGTLQPDADCMNMVWLRHYVLSTPNIADVVSPCSDGAGSVSNVDTDDAAPAASTRRRIMRRQTAAAAATAVARPAAKLATAAHLSGLGTIRSAGSSAAVPLSAASRYAQPDAGQASNLPQGAGSSSITAWEPGTLLAATGTQQQSIDCMALPLLD
jgi:hypothetical protein